MSLSTSLNNAVSGLTASARGAEVVSSNIANASTPGYGRRNLLLGTRITGDLGAGVQVIGIERVVDRHVIADRRIADGRVGFSNTTLGFITRLEELIGVPGDTGSLSEKLAQFEGALIFAANRPDADARLQSVVEAGVELAAKLNAISDRVQEERMIADRAIAEDVNTLNVTLDQIEVLNAEVRRATLLGSDPLPLVDQRQVLIDKVSEIVPVKEIDRGDNQVALFTPGGSILLDGTAAEFGFAPVGVITPDMTRAAGSLSGLTINGQVVNLDSEFNGIRGGRLEALFEIRDVAAVTEQARVDAVARDLVERFQDPAVDPTLAVGDPGIFTDRGSAFDPLQEEGLAGRIAFNDVVNPETGGELRRLRDGLNASVPGEVGDATQLNALTLALTDLRTASSSGFSGVPRSASGISAEFLSLIGAERQGLETAASFHHARQSSLREMELLDGVDTDQEMQKLLLVEQAYAANARVIQVVDEMMARLMEI